PGAAVADKGIMHSLFQTHQVHTHIYPTVPWLSSVPPMAPAYRAAHRYVAPQNYGQHTRRRCNGLSRRPCWHAGYSVDRNATAIPGIPGWVGLTVPSTLATYRCPAGTVLRHKPSYR